MLKKLLFVAMAVVLVLALAACGATAGDDHGGVIATINGQDVYAEEYEGYLGSYYQSAYGNYSMYQMYYGVDLLDEASASEMLGSMEYYSWNVLVQAAIIRELATEYGVTFDETFLEDWLPYSYLMGMKTSILYNDLVPLIQAEMEAEVSITDEEIQEAYDADPAAWDSRKTSHILIMCDTEDEEAKAAAYEEAVSLIERLNAGEDFATLAEEYSDDSSYANGGVIDSYINVYGNAVGTDTSFYEEYVTETFALAGVGDFSQEPVLSSAGYHIIRIDDIREGLEASKEAIRSSLSAVTSDDAVARLGEIITERSNNAVIEIKEDIYKYYVEIEEDGTTEDGTTEDGTEDGTTEDGTTEDGTTEDGTTEDGTTEDGTTEDGTTEDGTTDPSETNE